MSQSKIKTLFKIFYIRSKFIFTIFFFLTSAAYHSEIFATDDSPTSDLSQALLGGQRSPEVGHTVVTVLHSVNERTPVDDRVSVEGVGLSPMQPSTGRQQAIPLDWGDADGDEGDAVLCIPTSVREADAEMDKIIECIAFLEDGEYTAGIAQQPGYSHMSSRQLRKHLIAEAWKATREGPLTEVVSKLSEKEGKLIARYIKLKGIKEILERDQESFVRTCAAALQMPSIADMPELQSEIIKINHEARTSRTTIKYLKYALGALTFTAVAGCAAILVLHFT